MEKFKFDILGWFLNKLNKLNKGNKPINKKDIVLGILKRRGYVEQAYNGGSLHVKEFTFVTIIQDVITIGTDIDNHASKGKGYTINGFKLTDFMIAIKYFER